MNILFLKRRKHISKRLYHVLILTAKSVVLIGPTAGHNTELIASRAASFMLTAPVVVVALKPQDTQARLREDIQALKSVVHSHPQDLVTLKPNQLHPQHWKKPWKR
jgi:hypothetical protein